MQRLTENEVLTHAGRAIGKVERFGARGLSMINHQETEALVIVATLQGIPPIKRSEQMGDTIKGTRA